MFVINQLLFTLLISVSILLSSTLPVQAVNSDIKNNLSVSLVRDKIDNIKAKEGLEETLKLKILQYYYTAEDNLEELQTLVSKIQINKSQLKTHPGEIEQLQKTIQGTEAKLKQNKQGNYTAYTTDELEQRLDLEKTKLETMQSSISRLELQVNALLNRPQEIREQKLENQNLLPAIQQEQASLVESDIPKLEAEALSAKLTSQRRLIEEKINWLDSESSVYSLNLQLKKLELQHIKLQVELQLSLVTEINGFVNERRKQEFDKVKEELKQAELELAGKPVVIQTVARENIRYTVLQQELNKKIEHYENQKSEIDNSFKLLEKDFQSADKKIKLAGLSPALGNLLREQRRKLPLSRKYQTTFDTIQKEIALSGLEQFQLEEAQKSVIDIDQEVQFRLASINTEAMDEQEKLVVRTDLRRLLTKQKSQVLKLSAQYEKYSRILADVDFNLQQLVTLAEKYSLFLDQRLLWVRSAPMINIDYLLNIAKSLHWLSEPLHWRNFAVDIESSIQANPLLVFTMLVLLFLQFWLRKRVKINQQEVLRKGSKLYTDHFEYTFYSMGYAFLLALPFASITFCLGVILILNGQILPFSLSVAHGLLAASIPLLLIQFFYQLFKPSGVVHTLFNWQEYNVLLVFKQLKWLRFIAIPSVFILGMFSEQTYTEHSHTLGRMALIIAMMAISVMLHRFAHPVNGLPKEIYLKSPNSWLSRLRYLWYTALVLMPIVIIGFAVVGYYQSALELQQKLIVLLRLIFFSGLLHEIILRGMVLGNRQLALKNARQKRKSHEQAEQKDKTGESTVIAEEELLLNIPKIKQQSQALLKATIVAILLVGSWLNFEDLFPALSIFNQIVLWQHTVVVDGDQTIQSITLINLFVGIFYLVLMLVFVNNLSGLLDLIFVGRFSMTAGGRYALIQLTRYLVIILTFIIIANELGGSWSQVQWLVAALSVGLGFGLQEIFANMVSGIILLFERPIRVGDTVTVGDVSGKVCRIQMRATTISDWDQKELIVPNKTFITERLVNWTLTDTITRVVIPVGVSYNSDDELVKKLLEQVVAETPLILKDPAPSIFFVGLGDSSLDYSIRVFTRDLGDRLPVTDDLHVRIRRVFKEHNIEIPFPQRDLHIRSTVVDNLT